MTESSGLIPLYLGDSKVPHQARVDFVDNKLIRILFEDEEFSQSMYNMIEEGTFRGVTLGWIQAVPREVTHEHVEERGGDHQDPSSPRGDQRQPDLDSSIASADRQQG